MTSILTETLSESLAVDYLWSAETGEVTTLLRTGNETLSVALDEIATLPDVLSESSKRGLRFRSECRAQANHPKRHDLIPTPQSIAYLAPNSWMHPAADITHFGTPVIRWNGYSDVWEVLLLGLINILRPRIVIPWDDAAKMGETVALLLDDALLAEAALVEPHTVTRHKDAWEREKLLREAGPALADARANIALTQRTLVAGGIVSNGYSMARYRVGALHLPNSPSDRKAACVVIAYPRWNRRGGDVRPMHFERIKQLMAGISYHHVTATPGDTPLADVFSPADPEVIAPYRDAISHRAASVLQDPRWGSAI